MSYKVLITTQRSAGSYEGGVGLHTLVVDVDDELEAKVVVANVNGQSNAVNDGRTWQYALPLNFTLD